MVRFGFFAPILWVPSSSTIISSICCGVLSSTRMWSNTDFFVWFVLFCLVHIPLLAFVDIGIRPVSLMRYSMNFPLRLVCCVHWGWLMPILALKSPVRIIPPCCFSMLICVLSLPCLLVCFLACRSMFQCVFYFCRFSLQST